MRMSQKKVSKTIITCDRCMEKGEHEKPGPFANGGMEASIKAWSRGYDGAAGGGSRKIDLCEKCMRAFNEFMEMK
jgi:hypothetical protein